MRSLGRVQPRQSVLKSTTGTPQAPPPFPIYHPTQERTRLNRHKGVFPEARNRNISSPAADKKTGCVWRPGSVIFQSLLATFLWSYSHATWVCGGAMVTEKRPTPARIPSDRLRARRFQGSRRPRPHSILTRTENSGSTRLLLIGRNRSHLLDGSDGDWRSAKGVEGKQTLIYSLGFSPRQKFQSESGCSSEVSPEGQRLGTNSQSISAQTRVCFVCAGGGEGVTWPTVPGLLGIGHKRLRDGARRTCCAAHQLRCWSYWPCLSPDNYRARSESFRRSAKTRTPA